MRIGRKWIQVEGELGRKVKIRISIVNDRLNMGAVSIQNISGLFSLYVIGSTSHAQE